MLNATGIDKRFGAVSVLEGVQLTLRAGEVHAVMGQNGAGKSTLIKILTGVIAPNAGTLSLAGQAIAPESPLAAQRLGISTVYQEVNLCPNLTVAENIFAGRYPRRGWTALKAIDGPRMLRETRALLQRLNIAIDPARTLGSLPVAMQQLVAIARALSVDAKVLILDEPTSSLDDSEVESLFAVLRGLRQSGLAILFVTHFLDQVYAIADRITVLRNGRFVGEWTPAQLPAPALVAAMVGRDVALASAESVDAEAPAKQDELEGSTPRLSLRGFGAQRRLHPLSLDLHAGEVVGVAGLLGSGRTELARLMFGLDAADFGTLQVQGQAVRFTHPAQAVRLGLAFCPEERKADGIVGELSVRENIVLALQARAGLWPCIRPTKQRELAQRYIELLGIRAADSDMPIALLSGGNQQKALLARWLATSPRVLILDEPTRGVDVAAKQELMNEVMRLARDGMSVLFISSEIDEVLRISDRIVVLRDRRKAGELPRGASEAQVMDMICEPAA
ncbi:sugar ABC transporter ATP-binding protein [Scleromatobacter humisilvae]|uniref:Sugar ABC transporter ATP-binding protein n=1 Tax=Scleromatobacter humisilvae TaxID=2897159 RepID=A0A9X1YK51_9BURK|nr:sugar ABC transporter ATP-binding protein [Scleromatobacter humisilvae]MCK9686323.1 sugar ABC transporter ATP-binding protein [Scleromatobacter humisilvae]